MPAIEAGVFAPARHRPQFLTFTRKILLTLMGIGLVSAIIGSTMKGTHSTFTASVVNPANTFQAGTLQMTNDNNNGSVCSATAASSCGVLAFPIAGSMILGTAYTTTVTIRNSGSLPAVMTAAVGSVRDDLDVLHLYQHLNVTIAEGVTCLFTTVAPASCDPTNAAVPGAVLPLGSTTTPVILPPTAGSFWAPAESHTYTIAVEVDSTAPTGAQTAFDLIWVGQEQ